MSSFDFGVLRIWTFKDRRVVSHKDIDCRGYCLGLLPFENDDYFLVSNYLKEFYVVSGSRAKIVHSMYHGLSNSGSLVHLKDRKKVICCDLHSENVAMFGY